MSQRFDSRRQRWAYCPARTSFLRLAGFEDGFLASTHIPGTFQGTGASY